ncbi:HNH endonuclease signature motif containing protein, partial [Clostridium frigidicarnis]
GSQTSASAAGVGRVPIKSFGSSKNTQSIKQTETQKSFNAALASRNVEGASEASPYAHLGVGPGKNFTAAQKRNIIQENMKNNGGVVKSDLSSEVLVKPSKSQRGVTPPQNEWQIDHIDPRDKGGSNAQILSRKENREKWNK